MTVLANRVSSSKAAKLCRAEVSDEVVKRTKELLNEGCGLFRAVKLLRKEGITSTVRGEERPITYGVLRKRLIQEQIDFSQYAVIRHENPKTVSPVIERFIRDRCIISKDSKEFSGVLYTAYVKWCGNEIEPQPRRAFADNVKRMGFRNYRSTKSRRRWQGLKLLDAE